MKVVILAGGKGTRIQEESVNLPKPMISIGPYPMLWHIMKAYSSYGLNDFIICLGYKGYIIKEYFLNYREHNSDFTIDTSTGEITYYSHNKDPWRITLIDTGQDTMTGGRILKIKPYVKDLDYFYATYGDGLSNVDINNLTQFHKTHGKIATLTSVKPVGRFGALKISGDQVDEFREKEDNIDAHVNGGFFVFNQEIFDYIHSKDTVLEEYPLCELARRRELMAYKHPSFWHPMDTLRDKIVLEKMWEDGDAPWKIW